MDELTAPTIPFDNSYARLPDRFFARLVPTPVREPRLIALNGALAADLGLDPDWLSTPGGVAVLAGNRAPRGAEPLAQVYAGHQFGGWVPQLGDGRAILLGEVLGPSGARRDIQLKGAGPTPYSRMGDGRAPLGPVLREYIVSEAMAALGVPTTRSLAAVATGEPVLRESGPLPGGVLTRVAASHIRVGTFEFFGYQKDKDALRRLVDHALARHYPGAKGANPAAALLERVIAAQARLIARWMSVGFVHGVMNTDNMTISGETIDYGPCAFLDAYDPKKTFSSIDRGGRYAFGMQPRIAHWNLARLAIALVPILAEAEDEAVKIAQDLIGVYPASFEAEWLALMKEKLGLPSPDRELTDGFLALLEAAEADHTLAFRHLADAADGDEAPLRALFPDQEPLDGWLAAWRERIGAAAAAGMRRVNPLYIPRNHLVEEAVAAGYEGDFAPFKALNAVLSDPFSAQRGRERYAAPPRPEEVVTRTFCGT